MASPQSLFSMCDLAACMLPKITMPCSRKCVILPFELLHVFQVDIISQTVALNPVPTNLWNFTVMHEIVSTFCACTGSVWCIRICFDLYVFVFMYALFSPLPNCPGTGTPHNYDSHLFSLVLHRHSLSLPPSPLRCKSALNNRRWFTTIYRQVLRTATHLGERATGFGWR